MKLLLDSHTFLWWRDNPENLSPVAYSEISNSQNEIFVSIITLWELQIKINIKKLEIKDTLKVAVEDELQRNRFQILPI